MAISLIHPVFLLILSIFFLPTLLAIPFDDCGFESYPIKVTGVELFEEQYKASFNITVSTNKVITGGIVHLQVQYGYKTIMDHTYNLSELITCPVSPGAAVLSFRKQFPYAKELMTPMIYLNLIEEPHEEEIMCLVFCYDTSSSGVVFA